MALYLYIPGESGVHRLHPTVKLAGMICFFIASFVTERPLLLLPLVAGVLVLLAVSGSLANIKRLRVLFALVFVMTFIIWCLFYQQGVPWFSIGPLTVGPFPIGSRSIGPFSIGPLSIGPQSVRYAFGMALKLTTFLAVGTLFLSTAKVEEFAYALTRLGLPYKIGFTMTLAFRLVPAFVEAGFTVVQAQRCRGFDFDEGSILKRIRRYVPVIVPVFIGALRRADNMAMALEARGFQSGRPRTFYQRYRFGARDVFALVVLALIAAGYLWMWKDGLTHL